MAISLKTQTYDRFIPVNPDEALKELSSYRLRHSDPGMITRTSAVFFREMWRYDSIKEVPVLYHSTSSNGKRKYEPEKEPVAEKKVPPIKLAPLSKEKNTYKDNEEYGSSMDFFKQYLSWSANDVIAHFTYQTLCISKFNREDRKLDSFWKTTFGQELSAVHFVDSRDTLVIGGLKGNLTIIPDISNNRLANYNPLENLPLKIQSITSQRNTLVFGDEKGRIGVGDLRVRLDRFTPLYCEGSICSLTLTNDYQLAYGTSENTSGVIDLRKNARVDSLKHNAAIKGLDWISSQRLVTGAGTSDRRVRIWDIENREMLTELDTGAQVCHLIWLKSSNTVFTCQGFSPSNAQANMQVLIQVFKPDFYRRKLTPIAYHESYSNSDHLDVRVLHSAVDPTEQIVATYSSKNIAFWDVSKDALLPNKQKRQKPSLLNQTTLR